MNRDMRGTIGCCIPIDAAANNLPLLAIMRFIHGQHFGQRNP